MGSRSSRHTPRLVEVAKVAPPSANDRWAGPATLGNEYGPVTVASTMFSIGVRADHGPKRTRSSRPSTSTHAVSGVTPKARAKGTIRVSKAKLKRRVPTALGSPAGRRAGAGFSFFLAGAFL